MANLWRVTTLWAGTYVVGGGINQLYFAKAGGTAQQAATAVKTFWTAMAGYAVSGTTAEVQNSVEELNEPDGEILGLTAVTGGTTTFTGGSANISPATQGLVRLRTGVYDDGREIRGRIFLPAMMQSLGPTGFPASSLISGVGTAVAALIADTNSTLSVYRRYRKYRPQVGVKGEPWYLPEQQPRDGISAAVATGDLWSKWATLRSRRD